MRYIIMLMGIGLALQNQTAALIKVFDIGTDIAYDDPSSRLKLWYATLNLKCGEETDAGKHSLHNNAMSELFPKYFKRWVIARKQHPHDLTFDRFNFMHRSGQITFELTGALRDDGI